MLASLEVYIYVNISKRWTNAEMGSLEVNAYVTNRKAHADIVNVKYMLTSPTIKLMLT